MKKSHRCEVVIKHFVDIKLCAKKTKKLAKACAPPSDAAVVLNYCRVSRPRCSNEAFDTLDPSAVSGRKPPNSLRLLSRIWCSRRYCFPGRSSSNATARPWLHSGAKSIVQRQRFQENCPQQTVASSVHWEDPIVFLSIMQWDTEADAPLDGTVPDFFGTTNTSVSSGRAFTLLGVAGGTLCVAMSDKEAVRCVLVLVIQMFNRSEFPEPRLKSYAMSWCCCSVIDVCRASFGKTASPEDGLARVQK